MAKSRAKREPLTRERVLRAALAIVDREGLAAISMRRVGEELGVEAMSLYNHVANKAAMLDGIFELVLAELEPAKPATSFELGLRERALALRAVLRAHPRALTLFASRPAVTPGSLAHVESVLDCLLDAGFGADDALSALHALVAYVVGHSLASYAEQGPDELAAVAYEELDRKRFPRVRAVARRLHLRDREREFEFGLELLLAGLAERLRGLRH